MNIMQAVDAVNGREGYAIAEINGNVEQLAELSNLTATVEFDKADFKAMGTRNTQNKLNGWSGSGSMTVRYISSRWARLAQTYAKEGRPTYFTIVVTNHDPSSASGTQTIQLLNCMLDSVDIAKLDIDSEILEQDFDFTFDDFNVLQSFNPIY